MGRVVTMAERVGSYETDPSTWPKPAFESPTPRCGKHDCKKELRTDTLHSTSVCPLCEMERGR